MDVFKDPPDPSVEPTETVPFPGAPARAAEPGAGPLARGASVGRYLVLDVVGTGGMGVVYAGYDPELDRKVALKLLRPDRGGEAARQRLVREAQATARLSHPNVVTVYDAGTVGDEVFIAMELVEGQTLRHWLKERPRAWREVLGPFLAAGRGLAAAHAAGLVHRDFKPDNVLLGHDGRVRVADFGLARSAGGEASPETEPEGGESLPPSGPPGALASPLTDWGAALGTPGYMAPEQLRGEPADACSDQFSFCVALWEALYGARPFSGADSREPGEPPAGSRVPARVRSVLLRGLELDPAARHPSMDALLDALGRDPATARRRWLAAAGVLLAVAAGFGGIGYYQARGEGLCRGGEEKVASLWSPVRKEAARQAFRATGLPLAGEAWAQVERGLDGYFARWAAAHRESCEATRVRGEQSEDLLDRRMFCLEGRLEEAGALVRLFAGADRDLIQRSMEAVSRLAVVEECADTGALLEKVPPPVDPEVRAAVEAIRAELAEVKAMAAAGRFDPALARALDLRAKVAELPYAPLEAEALFVVADLREKTGDFSGAVRDAYESLWAAEEGRDDLLRARVWKKLVYTVGYRQSRYDEALQLARHARAVNRRLGDPPELESGLLAAEGSLLVHQNRLPEAIARFRQAIRLDELATSGGPRPELLSNLGNAYHFQGDMENALVVFQRAHDLMLRTKGRQHPDTASVAYNVGTALSGMNRLSEAEEVHRRALADREAMLGPNHPDVAESLSALAGVWAQTDEPARAVPLLERAVSVYRQSEPRSLQLGLSIHNLGEALRKSGRLDEAEPRLREAHEMMSALFGRDSFQAALPRDGLGHLALERGDPAEAAALLESAQAVFDRHAHPGFQADARFGLARALWALGRERDRAIRLAEEAREFYRSFDPAAEEIAATEEWLAQRRQP